MRAPLTSAWSAKTVLPAPGPPMMRLVRWHGSPPYVILSKPSMPVSDFSIEFWRMYALPVLVMSVWLTVRKMIETDGGALMQNRRQITGRKSVAGDGIRQAGGPRLRRESAAHFRRDAFRG